MRRPGRRRRGFGALLALLFAASLFLHPEPLDVIRRVTLCGLFVFAAISPRSFYDGRVAAWERDHPVASAAAVFVFLGLLAFNAFTLTFSPQVSVLAGAVLSAAVTAFAFWRGRRRFSRR